jgi:hypothetical protein
MYQFNHIRLQETFGLILESVGFLFVTSYASVSDDLHRC